MRVLAVSFQAAADGQKVIIDRDCKLVTMFHSSSTALACVSWDPSRTIASLTGPSATGTVTTDLIGICRLSTVPVTGLAIATVEPQLNQGESVFVSASAAGTVALFLDP